MDVAFWAMVDQAGDCWPWTGRLRGEDGYGGVTRAGRTIATHRYAYADVVGEIPPRMVGGDGVERETFVLHRCDNPPCCRPSHLWLGTVWDNNRDMQAKGRVRNGAFLPDGALPNHCPSGHLLSGDNLGWNARGFRYCRTCHREANRTWHLKRAPRPSEVGCCLPCKRTFRQLARHLKTMHG